VKKKLRFLYIKNKKKIPNISPVSSH